MKKSPVSRGTGRPGPGQGPARPRPPQELVDQLLGLTFKPAPEVGAWVREVLLERAGPLFNVDHQHLLDAEIGYLWASAGFRTKGRGVIGTAEDLSFAGMGNAWKRARADQQFVEWFGTVPRFLITLDGHYCSQCTDADFCALVEHELYHLWHVEDEFQNPVYGRDGQPKLGIRGHDVEEFVGVVRRYGIGDPDSTLARLVIAAASGPRVEGARISHACGTCLAKG